MPALKRQGGETWEESTNKGGHKEFVILNRYYFQAAWSDLRIELAFVIRTSALLDFGIERRLEA